MDRNQLIGLVLISAMLVGYLYFFGEQPKPEETISEAPAEQIENNTEKNNSGSEERMPESSPVNVGDSTELQADSISVQEKAGKWGALYANTEGKEKYYVLENEVFKIKISNKGAGIKEVVLKKHVTYEKQALVLLDSANHQMDWLLTSVEGKTLNLSDLYYSGKLTESEEFSILSLSASASKGSIKHIFKISPKSYVVDYKIQVNGLNDLIANKNVQFYWQEDLKRFENVIDQSRNHTAVNYYNTKGDFEEVTNDADAEKVIEKGVNDVKWLSMKQKFFNSGLISSLPMQNGEFSSEFDPNDSSTVKSQTASIEIPFQMFSDEEQSFQFYFGPNNFSILKKVTEGYGENVYLGWTIFASVNKYTVVPFFNFLENYISNYGLIILILVFVVKLILSPLSYRSYVSMAKMKVLRPEIEQIKEKIGDDQQKVQMETMQLYQKFGVNPLSGCVPMILQIPVLFALFNFFPNSVELRQKSFLWAHDLSTYDSILDLPFNIPFYGDHVSLFTLLMTLSTLAYTYVQNQNNPMQQQGPMKTMQYFFPVMIMFFLNNFSSGLTYYYFLSNVITIAQQLLIARFIDDKAIRDKLETKKEKRSNKKKSGFSARLEEAMKAQQQKQKNKGKGGRKK
ncbi:membrane protein insertase YidC [Hyphobacterium sp. CCMP332]|nr:membrane protein insertase YidC [Hyphobacterium sp. CCMP332]